MAAVSSLTVPSTWDVVLAGHYVAAASNTERAVVLVSATDGPMPMTKEAVLLLVQKGVRELAIALHHPFEYDVDEEILELVEMEMLALVESYGFSGETVQVVHLKQTEGHNPAELWSDLRKLLDDMDSTTSSAADSVSAEADSSSDPPAGWPRVDSNTIYHESLELASLSVIGSAPGRRVRDGHATALAAHVDGKWWAPEFQFVGAGRAVHDEVPSISQQLGGREDVVGVLSWWLTTNAWLDGARPCDLVGTGRTSDLIFAAKQVAAGNW